MLLINGIEQETITANDRAILFGDGCFTTARIIDGNVCLLAAHMWRLKDACNRLFIPFTLWDELKNEIFALASGKECGVIKVVLSRGCGGRGYSGIGSFEPTRILSVSAYPAHYNSWRSEGITLELSPVRLGRNPLLAGIKHLSRLEQVMISTYLDYSDAEEALVLDSEGIITECCAANLFWRKGKKVFTPRLDQAGVNGIMRQFCIQQLASSASYSVSEIKANEDVLLTADEVIICNALMPIVPVKAYGHRSYWYSRELYKFLSSRCEQAV